MSNKKTSFLTFRKNLRYGKLLFSTSKDKVLSKLANQLLVDFSENKFQPVSISKKYNSISVVFDGFDKCKFEIRDTYKIEWIAKKVETKTGNDIVVLKIVKATLSEKYIDTSEEYLF